MLRCLGFNPKLTNFRPASVRLDGAKRRIEVEIHGSC
jgi:hypothetical protein